MNITFKELRAKNILSYGAKETIITFEKGIIMVNGTNGLGKSGIFFDALSFCLFGKPYRDIKIKELINWKNKKNLVTSCRFVLNNQDEYLITRTLSPDSLEIHKNNSETDLLSSKKLNQEEINKILGINHTLFKQVISLAVNYNKPFLSLSAEEKRKIIEQIFNITVFGQMLKEAKKIVSSYIAEKEITTTSVKLLEENLKSLRKNATDLTKINEEFESNKQKDLVAINESLNSYQNDLNNLIEINTKLEKEINSELFNDISGKLLTQKLSLNNIVKEINNLEYVSNKNNDLIINLKTDIICPRCNTNLTEEHKESETNKLTEEINNIKHQLKDKYIDQINIKNEIDKIENLKFEYQNLKTQIEINNNKKISLEKEINKQIIEKEKIINKKLDIDLDKINKELNKKINEYKLQYKKLKNTKKSLEMYQVIIDDILSETGIKAFFFKKLVPILNNKINEYLKYFDLPVYLSFDELMNETITNHLGSKNNISYCSYSEGEKKRIDMAILFSFINITKAIANWDCNILLIDELLDSAIDTDGLEKLINNLKNMSTDNNMGIYIISHKLQQEYAFKFDKCLNIIKENGFSKIIEKRK